MTDRDTSQETSSTTGEKIGRVVSVSGARATVLLNARLNGGNGDGIAAREGALHALQIGSLLKIPTADTVVFGMVASLSIPDPNQDGEGSEVCLLEMELVGEGLVPPGGGPMTFMRGVSNSPTLGDGIYTVTQDDLAQVYAQPSAESATIGTIFQDRSLPA